MLPLKDCRGYRSRYINALNRAVRSLTPIAGRGIRLRQSAQGVVIESTAKGGGGGTVAPAVEPLRFLKVEYREISVGSSGSQMRWCVYLGKSVPFMWLVPKEDQAGVPWGYYSSSGTISPYPDFGGWYPIASQEELNALAEGSVFGLEIRFNAPSSTLTASMDVTSGHNPGQRQPIWYPSSSALLIPCAQVSGPEGARTITSFRVGEVSLELVAANACNLLLKRDGAWSEVIPGASAEEDDEFAVAQWWALRAHFHDMAHDEHTADVSLRESMYAYAGTPCVSHAADHVGGIV